MSEATGDTAVPYPVTYAVDPALLARNRATCAFRIFLALPHVLLVGTPRGMGISCSFGARESTGGVFPHVGTTGALGAVAGVMAILSWFAIVLTAKQPKGLWDFMAFYLRWRSCAVTYMALLRDEYPPFGDGEYPIQFAIGAFPERRDRLSVGLRLLFLLPHAIVLFVMGIAWLVTAVIGWCAILCTGAYPAGLYHFGVGYLRWSLRVESYLLLLHDQYPPFRLA